MGHINYNPSVLTLIGDHFKISVVSAITSCVVTLTGRMQGEDGEISDFRHDVVVTATGAASVAYPVPGGYWLMSALASISSGTVNPGDILVKVELMRGNHTSAIPYHLVLFGYPDDRMPVAMLSEQQPTRLGVEPATYITTVANPAPGTDLVITVPAGERWEVLLVSATLVASVAVASRQPNMELFTNAGSYLYVPASGTVTAGQTRNLNWSTALRQSYSSATAIYTPYINTVTLDGGSTISVYIDNIDVADQIGSARYIYRPVW